MFRLKNSMWKLVITFFVIIAAAVVIGLAVLMLKDSKTAVFGEGFYQYFMNERYDYPAQANLFIGKDGVVCSYNDKESPTDTTPVYFSDSVRFMTVRPMSFVDPYKGLEQGITLFTKFEKDKKGNIYRLTGKTKKEIDSGFLYDGKDTYVFLEAMVIYLDGKKYELTPFSFVVVDAMCNVRMYDYESDKLTQVEVISCDVTVSTAYDTYSVSLHTDTMIMSDGQERLLFVEPELLDPIE